jgi:hypothetical protein
MEHKQINVPPSYSTGQLSVAWLDRETVVEATSAKKLVDV